MLCNVYIAHFFYRCLIYNNKKKKKYMFNLHIRLDRRLIEECYPSEK